MSDTPVSSQPQQQQKQATAAQLRRIAKARPYVPIHEIRRTYCLPGDEDLTVKIATPDGDAWIGLPEREAKLVEQLVQQGEIGLIFHEMPRARVVLGLHGSTLHS
ncbi:MAG: hypothetical protein ACO3GA_01280 [Candidatus Limnocylindrus sp.]